MSEDTIHETMKVEPATIRGNVIGYIGESQTRAIAPATVFLLVQVVKDGKQELYYPATEKKLGKMSKSGIRSVEELQENYPDVYHAVIESLKSFEPVMIKPDDALGRFEFNNIPAGWWCYITAAFVEKKVYMHTDKRGNNGLGKNEVIHGKDLLEQDNRTIDNVVIPVEDEWLKKVKPAPKVKVYETDKDMDKPEHLKKMLMDDA